MTYILIGALLVGGFAAYKLHITSLAGFKAAVAAEVAKLEASAIKLEPTIKADIAAIIAKIKSLL